MRLKSSLFLSAFVLAAGLTAFALMQGYQTSSANQPSASTLSAEELQALVHVVGSSEGSPPLPPDSLLYFYSHWMFVEQASSNRNAPPWAGEYRRRFLTPYGEGSESLVVAPDAGFARMTAANIGGTVKTDAGDVVVNGPEVVLARCYSLADCGSKIYYPASLGACTYLIEAEQYDTFAASVKLSDDPYLKRAGSPAKCAEGGLRLPSRDVEKVVTVEPESALHRRWRNWNLPHRQVIDEAFLAQIPTVPQRTQPVMEWPARKIARESQRPDLPAWAGIYYLYNGQDQLDRTHVFDDFVQGAKALGPPPPFDFIAVVPGSGAFFHRERTGGSDVLLEEQYVAKITPSGQRLRLSDIEGESGRGLPDLIFAPSEYLYPVQLGARHYLMEEGDMPALINALNSGEPLNDFLQGALRAGDEKAGFDGPVKVPEPYASLVRRTPLAAKVTQLESKPVEVSSSGPFFPRSGAELQQSMRIDKGSRDGVFKGMVLYVQPSCHDKTCAASRGIVTAVREDNADVDVVIENLAFVRPTGYSRAQEALNWPRVGAAVSSIDGSRDKP